MEYYSAIEKKEILPLVTAQMDLDYTKWNMTVSKKKSTTLFHLHVETKEQNKWKNKIETDS